MINRHTRFIVFITSLSTLGFSQIKKGDVYYEKSEYFKAIPYYKKDSRSKQPNTRQEANVKLGNSYRLVSDYNNAEEAYRKALEIGTDVPPEIFYNYAQVLKTNNKYEEAAEQYNNYIKLSPNDENAKKALKFCKEIKYYLSRPIEYKIKNVESVNSDKAEFSPFVVNGKLMFVAERESFDFINYEVNDYNGQPYLNMYISNIEGVNVKKSKTFSKNVNSQYHDGPGCLSADGHTLYFSRVSSSGVKGKINQAQIYTATGSDRNWKNLKPIEINSSDYSLAHPSISADNTTLYFTSNMPGGYGGKDIWMSRREGESWGKPVNLGPDINTTGDEMFPSIKKDGTLFFSSNGLPGFGGLDIYSAKSIDSKWILQKNEGLDLNSSTDDFGITFLNDSVGYFSSNRAGGKGGDDIYLYEYESKSLEISGTVLLTENNKDFAPKKKVVLTDEKGNPIDSTYTNEKGFFSFKNLDGDQKYVAYVDEDDPQLVGKARYYLMEKDSVIERVSGKFGGKRFAFKNLPIDPNGLPDLYTDDDLTFAGTLVTGDKKTPMKNVKVRVVNEFGDVMEEATTNEYGAFAFRNIPSDQNYLVSIEDDNLDLPDGTKVTLNNRVGKEVKTFYKTNGKFSFKVLNTDQAMIKELNVEDDLVFSGNLLSGADNKAIKNTKVKLLNEAGDVIEETTTDENGAFAFKTIHSDKNYIVSIDEGNVDLPEGSLITLTNKAGKMVKTFNKEKGNFSFKVLNSDKSMLSDMMDEDVNLVMDLYGYMYDQDQKPIANAKIKVKDEDGSHEQVIATTDKGKFKFKNLDSDKNYIFETDENDPGLVGVRRIYIADNKGRVYKVVDLNSGKFSFKLLEADKQTLGEFTLEDPSLKLADNKKAVVKKEKETKPVAVVEPKPKKEKATKPVDETKAPEAEVEEEDVVMTIVENIYYPYGKFALDTNAKATLDKAVDALMANKKLIMEISSHTDAQSSSGFNMNLSRKRAQTSVDYLVSKGIARSRLKATGFGETRILNRCIEGVECPDEEHKVNRRTEFKITKPAKR